jgi:hypothetical protein
MELKDETFVEWSLGHYRPCNRPAVAVLQVHAVTALTAREFIELGRCDNVHLLSDSELTAVMGELGVPPFRSPHARILSEAAVCSRIVGNAATTKGLDSGLN